MAEEAGKASGIEKFDGTDFAYWRMQIEDYLYGRKLHLPLLGQNLRVCCTQCCKGEDHSRSDEGFVQIDFDDEIRALIVLAFLPNSWEAMRMAVSNSTGKEKLKYNDIRDLILAEEIRRRDAGETSGSGSALNLETRGRGNNRNSNQGRSNSRNSNRNRSKSRSGQQVQCWNCGKTVDSPLDDWVLDSGASFHTTPHREIIQNYVAGDFGKVYLADGSALDVVGLGDVRISLPNGSVWLLEKVRHIPDLRRNLISVGQLDDEGHAILFVGGIGRLGHMSEKGMKMLLSKGKLPELKTPKAEKLELVHTDLWGPSPVASLGGSRNRFESKCLRLDNGGEYIDGGLVSIVLHRELGWRRPFLGHQAECTAAYLINRGPSVPMEFRLPEEVWNGKEVKFSHLKVFGCVSYVHIDSDARSKLDAKSVYDEALQDENSSKWESAMKNEMDSLLGNQTWD
ncbi:Retrovirus-related Pol polyprotein from transposon TNT 1-94 [Vitis vinifera]|uniref:Retrovirus-related Pol polyprotein from transposon TNT 1-94 n=1 Tax=Vitis vinifera TaxID=29760 RepID=A0A438CLZ5_VITVI|nr:Retrovirus-related Pol polyprotein from transposon TNT 1-94 [Vitis vinifera]